jgi:hypothetical protein
VITGAAAAWPLAARAQEAGKVPRIGYLSPGSASASLFSRDDAFRQGLRELGYVEGKNIVIEYRFAEGKFDRLADLAAELVRLKVDVIVAVGTQASLARGCNDVDPYRHGWRLGSRGVRAHRKSCANVTGTSSMTAEAGNYSHAVVCILCGRLDTFDRSITRRHQRCGRHRTHNPGNHRSDHWYRPIQLSARVRRHLDRHRRFDQHYRNRP